MPNELKAAAVENTIPELADTLSQVAAEVLETMFFTEALVTDCEHAWLASAVSAHIHFKGSHHGDMLLSVSSEAADSIAPSFLGIDPSETTGAERGEVILELSNIL